MTLVKSGIVVPFWFWNGDLEETEIARQIALAARSGVTGLALHPREGNRIPYLGPRWMELYRYACQLAQSHNLQIWLYDEEGYPSGSCGGRIIAKGPEWCSQYLAWEEMSRRQACATENVLAAFLRAEPETVAELKEGDPNERLLVFHRMTSTMFPDALSRRVTDEFIRLTHEAYRQAVGEYFGTVITAVFTDDNNLCLAPGNQLAWCEDLPTEFQARRGYNLLACLSSLVENVHGFEQVRLDYYRTLAELFAERFVTPIREWCDRYGLKLYGHLNGDEGPIHCQVSRFADPGTYFMAMRSSGMDDYLTPQHDNGYMRNAINDYPQPHKGMTGFPITTTAKQASSVANQLFDGECMAETFASEGWGVPIANLHAESLFLNILGVNVSVPHDYSSCTVGLAKRDHPASYFFQQPYFRYRAEYAAPASRSLSLMHRGRVWADTLVLHPMQQAQATWDGEARVAPGCFATIRKSRYGDVDYYSELLAQLNLELLRAHVSFEYGFESVLERHAKVAGGYLVVGKARYSTVIVPFFEILSKRMATLLKEFQEVGGNILFLGNIPRPAPFGEMLLVNDWEELLSNLPTDLLVTTTEKDADLEIGVGIRLVDGRREVMAVNFGRRACHATLALPKDYLAYDPISDTLFQPVFPLRMEPLHAVHFLPKGALKGAVSALPLHCTEPMAGELQELEWDIRADSCNVLRIGQGAIASAPHDFDCGAWSNPLHEPIHAAVRFQHVPEHPCIAFEPDCVSALWANGVRVLDEGEAMTHPATADLRVAPLDSLVGRGVNIFAFQTDGKRPEYLYLLGDFSVGKRKDELVIQPPRPLKFGDLAMQGMPCYWGTVDYAATFQWNGKGRVELVIPKLLGGVVSVEVNDQRLPVLPCAPWRYELTALSKRGRNSLCLHLCPTAQNFFGPDLAEVQDRHSTAFYPGRKASAPRAWLPYGLATPPELFIH
ncbi:MAG: hypothetical protein IJJ33_07085 [Victivallales bacterium]|nr:hypothetical protein [Victivallales bacterium]